MPALVAWVPIPPMASVGGSTTRTRASTPSSGTLKPRLIRFCPLATTSAVSNRFSAFTFAARAPVASPPATDRSSTPPSPNSFTGRFSGITASTVLMALLIRPMSAAAVPLWLTTVSVACSNCPRVRLSSAANSAGVPTPVATDSGRPSACNRPDGVMLTLARPAASSTSNCAGEAPTVDNNCDSSPPRSRRSKREPTVNAATGCVLVATALTDTVVLSPKVPNRLASSLRMVRRTALSVCAPVGSNTCMPLASARVESHSLHSTVMSSAAKVSKILGRFAKADVLPAALARVQSAGAPMPST
ncbi:hypothetical protein D3C71_1156110 [compost metagenome]